MGVPPEKLDRLFELWDYFEPYEFRSLLCPLSMKVSIDPIRFMSYLRSFTRGQSILLSLDPKLKGTLLFCEWFSKSMFTSLLHIFDRPRVFHDPHSAIPTILTMYDEMQYFRDMDKVDNLALEHLEYALQNLLKVHCYRVFRYDGSTSWELSTSSSVLAISVGYFYETSARLPPSYCCLGPEWKIAILRSWLPKDGGVGYDPIVGDTTSLSPMSNTQRFECRHHGSQSTHCYCRWMLEMVPSAVFAFFGYCKESFAHYFHTEKWLARFSTNGEPFSIRKALDSVFGGPRVDSRILHIRAIIFKEAILTSLHSFRIITEGFLE